MGQKVLSELSDQDLLNEAKKMKSESIISAALIGFMIGIVIYSNLKNSVGLFTLIPLFFAFKVFHKPDKNKELKELLKERNLN